MYLLSFAVYVGMVDPCLEDELHCDPISQRKRFECDGQWGLTVGALNGY